MQQETDELDGPLFRVCLDVRAEQFDRTTNEWKSFHVAAGTQWTVAKRGDVIDVRTAQTIRSEAERK
jgi:hypothetical protein